jgi:hypothetical protein
MPSTDKQKEAFSSIDRDCLLRAAFLALETLFSSEANGRRIVLRLKDLTLVDRQYQYLLRWKADSASSRISRYTFCEWMEREKMNALRGR